MRFGRPAVARHLHAQFAAVQNVAVQRVHGVFAVALVVEAHEGKTAGLARVGVPRYVDVANVTVLLEDALEVFRSSAISEVVHFERRHALDSRRGPTVTHRGVISKPLSGCQS